MQVAFYFYCGNMKNKEHIIKKVNIDSIAYEMDIEEGDVLLAINGQEIEDIFDYQYLCEDEEITVLIRKKDGQEWELLIEKYQDEDLGIEFEQGLMDEYRSCRNKCIFCFIDQMPKGMRDTLYFKDDDSRLSFLQGNYVTLTNMSDKDVDRIIRYHLSPINISFQTTNPELRCKMLNNRFAGEALTIVDRFFEAGITMNGQIVLCKDVNDGDELEKSISDLTKYIPFLESVSVVPVGLSKFREGLYELAPFSKEDAEKTLDIIEGWQKKIYSEHGIHFVHASDEFYILADREIPKEESYDGYLQLENGVGMVRSFMDEFEEAYSILKKKADKDFSLKELDRDISFVTGRLFYPYLIKMTDKLMELFPKLTIRVYDIRNDFFGETITVSGLLTGQDILAQLKGKALGDVLYLPQCLLRSGEEVLLDDMTVSELKISLQADIDIVKSSGWDLVETVVGERIYE